MENDFPQSSRIVPTCPGGVPESQSRVFFGNFRVPKKLRHQKWPKMAIFGYFWPFLAMYGEKNGRYWQEIVQVGKH